MGLQEALGSRGREQDARVPVSDGHGAPATTQFVLERAHEGNVLALVSLLRTRRDDRGMKRAIRKELHVLRGGESIHGWAEWRVEPLAKALR